MVFCATDFLGLDRLHVEKLKAIREQLLQQTGAEGLVMDNRDAAQQTADAEQRLLTATSSGISPLPLDLAWSAMPQPVASPCNNFCQEHVWQA